MRPFFYVANWKMNQSLANAQKFMQELKHNPGVASLPVTTKIVICPSFPHLGFLAPELKNTPCALGAQTCSPYASGAYTGQVATSALVEVGCSHCLIGHSERRLFCGETDQTIIAQYHQLVNAHITPIFCIGETEKEHTDTATEVLERQLIPLIQAYQENPAATLLIAYEPVWAIGTNKTPSSQDLTLIFSWLKKRLKNDLNETTTFFLYGGSVDETNSSILKTITYLDGFLVGNASLIFKKFKNIVV